MTAKERETIKEVLHASKANLRALENECITDAIDGLDISISKLTCLLRDDKRKGKKRT